MEEVGPRFCKLWRFIVHYEFDFEPFSTLGVEETLLGVGKHLFKILSADSE